MHELALFAGAGGGILGGKLLGWRTVCAVEWEPYAAAVLCARQNDGILPPFPIWDDVRTFDGRPWRGRVDVVSGGFPCQDISAAGKGAGIDGERSGMWREMARIIGEVGPRHVLVENSPMLVSRGLGRVLGDLAALGYNARWGVLGAIHAGAPHRRERIWIVADTAGVEHQGESHAQRWAAGPQLLADAARIQQGRQEQRPDRERIGPGGESIDVPDADGQRSAAGFSESEQREEGIPGVLDDCGSGSANEPSWWLAEPDVGRVANGVAARVDRLKALGNGQVPSVAALAWLLLNRN